LCPARETQRAQSLADVLKELHHSDLISAPLTVDVKLPALVGQTVSSASRAELGPGLWTF